MLGVARRALYGPLTVAVVFLLPVTTLHCRAARAAQPAKAREVYDLREQMIPGILPGTVIGSTAPRNWSHLILKSQPRVTDGDVQDVSQLTLSMARLLSVTTVANVKVTDAGGRPHYILEQVAIGLGTRINGQDVIIDSETQSQLGANLGLLARSVLSGTEAEMALFKQVVRSPTLLVFDAPTTGVLRNEHRRIVVRHAIVVDGATGQLNTLLWIIDLNATGEYTQAVGSMSLLQPNTLEARSLSVDSNEFTLGIPSSKAIAMVRIPPGQSIVIPPQLLTLAAAPRFTQDTARQLDAGLRELIRQSTGAPSTPQRASAIPAADTSRLRVK
jgi:hypothetical protein